MVVITENMAWPPMDLERHKMREHSAWYSGEAEVLSNFYYDSKLQDFLSFNYSSCNNNKFWARQIKNQSNFFIHIPIANDIAETSSSFLFGKTPIIRFDSNASDMDQAQKDLDDMLTKSGFFSKIVEGAEVASAMGGVFVKEAWDSDLSEEPIPMIVQCEQSFPKFKFGKLVSVTFMYELAVVGSAVYRLGEDVQKGKIINTLYQGTADTLGIIVPLTDCDAAIGIEAEVVTPDILTAQYIPNLLPNRLNRQSSSGRSDYQGIETLMDALDETFSDWMVDVQIARGKLHVPTGYIKGMSDGDGKFNLDKVMYEEMEVDPMNVPDPITATQFAIRADEFEKTTLNLMDRIITSAGYSPQSFGLNIQGRAESGTALNIRERKSFSTTLKKQSYWEEALKNIVKSMLLIKNAYLGGKFTCELDVNVAFSESIANNSMEVATCIKTLSDASAISTDTKVRMQHPEWTDTQVDEEIERINNDGSVGVPVPNPEDLTQMGENQLGGINNQAKDKNVPDVKQEGSGNKVVTQKPKPEPIIKPNLAKPKKPVKK